MFGKLSIIVKKHYFLEPHFWYANVNSCPGPEGYFQSTHDNKSYYSFEPLHKATWQDKGLTPQQTEKEGVAQHSPNITMSDSHEL